MMNRLGLLLLFVPFLLAHQGHIHSHEATEDMGIAKHHGRPNRTVFSSIAYTLTTNGYYLGISGTSLLLSASTYYWWFDTSNSYVALSNPKDSASPPQSWEYLRSDGTNVWQDTYIAGNSVWYIYQVTSNATTTTITILNNQANKYLGCNMDGTVSMSASSSNWVVTPTLSDVTLATYCIGSQCLYADFDGHTMRCSSYDSSIARHFWWKQDYSYVGQIFADSISPTRYITVSSGGTVSTTTSAAAGNYFVRWGRDANGASCTSCTLQSYMGNFLEGTSGLGIDSTGSYTYPGDTVSSSLPAQVWTFTAA